MRLQNVFFNIRELLIVRRFLKHKPGSVTALINHLENRGQDFKVLSGFRYCGAYNCIQIEDDIYGYEVKLGRNRGCVNLSPGNYNISAEQGDQIFRLILKWVPGSVPWVERKETEPHWPRN